MKRRDEIFRFRIRLGKSWEGLQEREMEFEETAAKRKMSLGLENLEERQKREIEAIDTALRRMEWGDYGLCQSCGRSIPLRRLQAVPWTPLCTRCAGEHREEVAEEGTPEAPDAGRPHDYQGIPDDELKAILYEELRNNGRVELEELDIDVHGGVIRLEGALPGETSHQILLDTLGFHEVENNIRIEKLAWQREDRRPAQDVKKTEDEEPLEGKDINKEVFHSCKSGKPVSPPDALVPEEEP